jgi:hypothetical protein
MQTEEPSTFCRGHTNCRSPLVVTGHSENRRGINVMNTVFGDFLPIRKVSANKLAFLLKSMWWYLFCCNSMQ